MIDSLSILLSTLACLFVLFRAVRLDRTVPWFETLSEPAAPDAAAGAQAPAPAPSGVRDPWEQ